MEQNPKLISDYKGGKIAAKKAIIGKVMASTGGLANPVVLNEVFAEIADE
jgi:Asp-tRNA(Asn)/Glu-tRNA(Gln) amidotransferase B subunit